MTAAKTALARPLFLSRFTCLGDACEDTCCRGWGMQVDKTTEDRWRKEAPDLIPAVAGEEGARIMRRDAKTDYCVKFEAGWCGIQKAHGEDFLSDACHLYPRATRRLADKVVMTATLSCPEIARLALLEEDAFTEEEAETDRLPAFLPDYLPEGLTPDQALGVHRVFIAAALNESRTPERSLLCMVSAAEALPRLAPSSWPEAAPFYLGKAEGELKAPEPRDTDPFYLMQALCGLIAAAKKVHNERLMRTVRDMESALHASVRWDTLMIAHLPDSAHAARTLLDNWKNQWRGQFAPLLRRYLAAQLSLALFPFGGFGGSPSERAGIIGVRFATVQLALMSLCARTNGMPPGAEVIRAVQSLSRFLDHLADPEFSVKIYQETGWLKPPRLRALVGDI